jgi:hypothetical protein
MLLPPKLKFIGNKWSNSSYKWAKENNPIDD